MTHAIVNILKCINNSGLLLDEPGPQFFWDIHKHRPCVRLHRSRSRSTTSRGRTVRRLLSSQPSHGIERSHKGRRSLSSIGRSRRGRNTIGRGGGTTGGRRCFARGGSGRRLSNNCLERNNVGILQVWRQQQRETTNKKKYSEKKNSFLPTERT